MLKLLVIIFLLLNPNTGIGQNMLNRDLSQLKVEELTNDQIKELVSRAEQSGMTQQQLENYALARGLPPSELSKLKRRIEDIQSNRRDYLGASEKRTRQIREEETPGMTDVFESFYPEEMDSVLMKKELQKQKIFGYNLFNNPLLTFEPSVNIATPKNYQIGPGDEIVIDIWGASQENYRLEVTPEGYIFISNLGPVFVNGLTVEKASTVITNKLTNIYSGLKGPNPNTFAMISLGNVRSIKVSVIGEVNVPGTYTISSLSTILNLLYLAGGPNEIGTLRDIEIIRNDKIYKRADIYKILIYGDNSEVIRLQDQDIVKVNPYLKRVEITGEVKRPAIYEIRNNESLNDLIQFAGGFSGKAYKQRIKLYRNSAYEQMILDITEDKFTEMAMENGDVVAVEPILNRFQNRVMIEGAVNRPGAYSLNGGLSLKQLIEKAEGLSGDAFLERTIIFRLNDDFTIKSIPVDLRKLMNGIITDVTLQKEDQVIIPSIFDIREDYFVQIEGEVGHPGKYPFVNNMTIEDLVLMAGGLLESASTSKLEVARRIKIAEGKKSFGQTAEVMQFSISENLVIGDSASNFTLLPFDHVFVRKSPGYEEQIMASVEGEVMYPGTYVISTKDERISDIINRAGGLTPEAYIPGARLVRRVSINEEERLRALEAIQSEAGDSLEIEISAEKEQAIGIDLAYILKNPHSAQDLILEERDILNIPKELQTVRLTGALLYPITTRYEKSFNFRRYIAMAGGYADDAKKGKTYVIYANGSIDRTRSLLGMKNYPKIEPGAEIVVPRKPERERLSTQELVSLTSVLSSTGLIIVTIVNNLK